MMPVLPVFIGTLSASGSAASSAGIAFSIMGGAGALSSVVTSRLARRFGIGPVMTVAFVGGGLLYLPLLFVGSLAPVFVITGFMGFFNGGLNTLAFGLVGSTVPKEKQGAAYGVAQSASSLAWGGGPLIGGAIAGMWGLREVFLVNSIALFATAVLAARLFRKRPVETEAGEAELAVADLEPAPSAATGGD
jgi:DHA1 family multidrug resistance protein-like MFS transporter